MPLRVTLSLLGAASLAACFQPTALVGPCTTSTDCPAGQSCSVDGLCVAKPSAPSHCSDHVLNGGETDVDCGGTCPSACALDLRCHAASDCKSGYCNSGLCANPPNCTNGRLDGNESDVDCGGSLCPACSDGKSCGSPSDCASRSCLGSRCQSAVSCADGLRDGDETDADCGGMCGATCAVGKLCRLDADCASGYCHKDSTCRSSLMRGLVAYWAMEERSGVRIDSSGGGSTLVPTSGVVAKDGKVGTAVSLGGPTWGESLSVDDATAVAFDGDFTFSAWTHRTDELYGSEFVASKVDEFALFREHYQQPDRFVVWLGKDSAQLAVLQSDPAATPESGWVFVVVWRRGSTLGLSLNASAKSTIPVAEGKVGSGEPFVVGVHKGVGYPWQGLIDEVGKWSRALSDEEINALYNGGSGKTFPF